MNEALVHWLMTPEAPDGALSLEDFLARPAWHRDALCKGETALYFSGDGEDVERATEICQRCPARQPCHDAAMADKDLEGVWGGFTAKERKELRRGRVA